MLPYPTEQGKATKGSKTQLHEQTSSSVLDMLELSAAAREIDLKYLDESGFCVWSEPGYTYYFKGEQKRLEQKKRRGRRLSIRSVSSTFNQFCLWSCNWRCQSQILHPDDGARSP
ncbi:hypothetical protein [Tolypothrix sp. VBCCA 56010]|uniref:hypothetical protein n=1 Tax=Tolypothrix sp. VBCCA 56010 TaxID=3137731 RepID=UPI003D7E7465